MKVRSLLLVNLLLVALMAGFAFWVAGIAPVGMELPTHWNAAGEVDQTMAPLPALLMPAGVSLFVALVFAVTPMLEPLQDKLDKSAPLLRAVWIGIMALFVALQGIIAAPVFGYSPGAGAIMLLVGLLFVVIGNTLPKSRPGFFVGIRTPWTSTVSPSWSCVLSRGPSGPARPRRTVLTSPRRRHPRSRRPPRPRGRLGERAAA